jgi:methylated-DNA-[protein]-cysteine S-methyltransferase
MNYSVMQSPIGPLTIVATNGALVAVLMDGHHRSPVPESAWGERVDDALPDATLQLEEYFAGKRQAFDLPLAPSGTEFQRRVWAALAEIPYGETRSYGQIATAIGQPGASRAVGMANGKNPVSIVVPCQRVVGASGSLTGYAGGPERKQFLLDLERGKD